MDADPDPDPDDDDGILPLLFFLFPPPIVCLFVCVVSNIVIY